MIENQRKGRKKLYIGFLDIRKVMTVHGERYFGQNCKDYVFKARCSLVESGEGVTMGDTKIPGLFFLQMTWQ